MSNFLAQEFASMVSAPKQEAEILLEGFGIPSSRLTVVH